MALSIGSNISSLTAQRSLSRATEQLGVSLERLSSGMRINRASDDAAGLSIADRLRSDSRLYSKALQNINDAISAVSIADAAIGNQTSILARLSELASQAANGTYSGIQRLSLTKEYSALLQEYGRIASTTSFNGIKLLQGGRGLNPSQMNIQAGIEGAVTSLLKLSTPDTGSFTGVHRLSTNWYDYSSMGIPQSLDSVTSFFDGALRSTTVTDSQGRQRTLLIGIGRHEDDPVSAQVSIFELNSGGSSSNTTATLVNYSQISLVLDQATARFSDLDIQITFSGGATARIREDLSKLRMSQDLGTFTDIPNYGSTTSIDMTSVVDQRTARLALDLVGNHIATLANIRGDLGALESRLQTAAKVVSQSRETTLGAESRIRDIDVANEAASLIANGILQKVASSVLAQANQAPALALRLLSNI